METHETQSDNWRLMRRMGIHETQRDYWTHETQRDKWRLMRLRDSETTGNS